MLKILERGKKKIPIYVYKTKCDICGCKFLYEDEDIFYYDGFYSDARYVECPQCDNSQIILFKRRYKGKFDLVEKVEDK